MNIHSFLKFASTTASIAFVAAQFSAQAATFNFAVDWLADENGQGLANGSLVMLVIDLNGDGILAPSATDYTPGVDDSILGTTSTDNFLGFLNNGSANDSFTLTIGTTPQDALGTVDSGDPISLLWFPDVLETEFLANSSNGPGVGSYGMFHPDTAISDGQAWVVPASNGDTVSLTARSTSAGNALTPDNGDVAQSLLTANLSTTPVPEPSSSILIVLSLGSLIMRRRRINQ